MMLWLKTDNKHLQSHEDGTNLFEMPKILKTQKTVENYVNNRTQKPKDILIAKTLPTKLSWNNLEWGWIIRVNILFCLGLGERLYSPTFLALSFVMGFNFLLVFTFDSVLSCHIKFFCLFSTHSNWELAINLLGFLSFFTNFQIVIKSPDLLVGSDLFWILFRTQVKTRI